MVWFASEWVHLLQMVQFLNLCMVEQAESFKILRSFRLEGTLESLIWKLLLKMGSAKRSDQVALGFVQSGIENPQEWRLHNCLDILFPCFISKAFIVKKYFPQIQSESYLQLMLAALPLCPIVKSMPLSPCWLSS